MSIQQQSLPFCGLNLKMYSTGKQSPSFEYQASSTKAKFQCSITKKLYDLTEVPQWINSPEVQRYVQAGYVLKWGSKIQQGKASQYSNGMELAITCYMIKPFNKSGYGNTANKCGIYFKNIQFISFYIFNKCIFIWIVLVPLIDFMVN